MSAGICPPTLRRLNQNRLSLALWDYGEREDTPVLLFLHGFMDTARSFEDLVGHLAADFRPLCLDWRGHGASDWAHADAGYHQLDHLRDLLLALDELGTLGLAPTMVVAHSMGGTLALMAAAYAPDLVPRLLLLDCLGGYAVTPEGRVEQMRAYAAHVRAPLRAFRSFPDRATAEARIRANNPGLSAAGAERMARHYFRDDEAGGLTPVHDPRLRGPNPYRFSSADWEALLAAVQQPVHVMAPEEGYLHRHDVGRRRDALPHASWEDVPGIGHHLHVEAPERVAEAIRRFSG